MSIETMKLALEALEDKYFDRPEAHIKKAITALRQAIEQAQKQEPVATMWQHGETGRTRITTPDSITDCDARWFKVSDLYTSPPQRQPLTDEELKKTWYDMKNIMGWYSFQEIARAIEAKLKEKNT